jgi:hypothetical protein
MMKRTRQLERSLASFTLALALAAASVLAGAGSAHAQELGTAGNLVFNVERVFGFYVSHQSVDVGPTDVETDVTDFSLLWNSPVTPLTQPRFGIDYFIDDHFTIGGNLGLFSLSNDADSTGILFAVRGGYALRLGHAFSFWPRGGLSFYTISNPGPADRNLISLQLEGMFTLAPAESWAFMVGPTIDVGFAGEQSNNDLTETCFGIMVGMIGWMGT